MKIYAYEVRQDEMGYFKEYEKKYGVSVVLNHQVPTTCPPRGKSLPIPKRRRA